MEQLIGILLLVSYLAVVIYVVRGGSPMLSFLALAIFWAALVGLPFTKILTDIIETPVEKNASTILIIIFGSWLGQVLVKTGIAGSMIKRAVELGGDRPLAVLIISILIVSFLFTSIYGVGAAIAVGIIIIPILLSMGIPPYVASSAFAMSIGGASLINLINMNIYIGFFPKDQVSYNGNYLKFAGIAFAIWVVFTILMAIVNMKRFGTQRAWAVAVDTTVEKEVPIIAYLAPALPVITIIAFKWPIIPSFLLGIAFAIITTKGGNSRSWVDLLHRTFYDGVTDLGGIIGVWVIVMMFMASGTAAASVLNKLVGPVIPHSPLTLAIFFAILAPLVIYRGPFALIGAGAAILAIMLQSNVAPPFYIFLMFCGPIALQNCMDPTNSWTLWTIGYTKVKPGEHFKAGLPFAWMAAAACCLLGFILFH